MRLLRLIYIHSRGMSSEKWQLAGIKYREELYLSVLAEVKPKMRILFILFYFLYILSAQSYQDRALPIPRFLSLFPDGIIRQLLSVLFHAFQLFFLPLTVSILLYVPGNPMVAMLHG